MIILSTNRFLPARLSNLEIWLSCIRSPITKDGSNLITQWNDISGNDRHATDASASHQPTFGVNTINGINAINFASGQYLDIDLSFLAGSDYTIYAVTRKTVVSGGQKYYFISTDYTPNLQNRCLHIGYFNPISAKFDHYSNPCDCSIPGYSGTQNQLWVMRFESAVGRYSQYISNNNSYTNTATGATSKLALINADSGKVGCGYDTTNYFRDDIAEIIVFSTAHSTSQQQWMRTYLQSTWGMNLQ